MTGNGLPVETVRTRTRRLELALEEGEIDLRKGR